MFSISWLNYILTSVNIRKFYRLLGCFCLGIIFSSRSNAILFTIKLEHSNEVVGVFDSIVKNWEILNYPNNEGSGLLLSAPMVIQNVLDELGDLNSFVYQFDDLPEVYPIHNTTLNCSDHHTVTYAGSVIVIDQAIYTVHNHLHFFISVQASGDSVYNEFYTIEGNFYSSTVIYSSPSNQGQTKPPNGKLEQQFLPDSTSDIL